MHQMRMGCEPVLRWTISGRMESTRQLELILLAQKIGFVHRHQVGELLQFLARVLEAQQA